MAKYYILCTDQPGDYCLWWRPNSQGYTCNLMDAGVYDEKEATSIQEDSHFENVAVPVDEARKHLRLVVPFEQSSDFVLEARGKAQRSARAQAMDGQATTNTKS